MDNISEPEDKLREEFLEVLDRTKCSECSTMGRHNFALSLHEVDAINGRKVEYSVISCNECSHRVVWDVDSEFLKMLHYAGVQGSDKAMTRYEQTRRLLVKEVQDYIDQDWERKIPQQ